jgi:hypothetical protein
VFKNTNGILKYDTLIYKEILYIHVDRYDTLIYKEILYIHVDRYSKYRVMGIYMIPHTLKY